MVFTILMFFIVFMILKLQTIIKIMMSNVFIMLYILIKFN